MDYHHVALNFDAKSRTEGINSMRQSMVGAMKTGERLVLQMGKCPCNYHTVFTDEKKFPSDKVFNYEAWKKMENYKKILSPDEDHDDNNN